MQDEQQQVEGDGAEAEARDTTELPQEGREVPQRQPPSSVRAETWSHRKLGQWGVHPFRQRQCAQPQESNLIFHTLSYYHHPTHTHAHSWHN